MKMRKDVLILLVIIAIVVIGGIYLIARGIGYFNTDPQKVLEEKIQENHGDNYEIMQVYKIGGAEGQSHGCGAYFVTDGNLISARLTADSLSKNYDNYTEQKIDYTENEEIKELMYGVNTTNMMYDYTNDEGEHRSVLKIIMEGNDYTDFLTYKQDIIRVSEYCSNLYDFSDIAVFIAHTADFDNIYYQAYTFKQLNMHPDNIYYDITESKTDMDDETMSFMIKGDDTTTDIEESFDTKYESIKLDNE